MASVVTLDRHLVQALNEAKELPSSREIALVITKIEEALLWLADSERKKPVFEQEPLPSYIGVEYK